MAKILATRPSIYLAKKPSREPTKMQTKKEWPEKVLAKGLEKSYQ